MCKGLRKLPARFGETGKSLNKVPKGFGKTGKSLNKLPEGFGKTEKSLKIYRERYWRFQESLEILPQGLGKLGERLLMSQCSPNGAFRLQSGIGISRNLTNTAACTRGVCFGHGLAWRPELRFASYGLPQRKNRGELRGVDRPTFFRVIGASCIQFRGEQTFFINLQGQRDWRVR